jgi:glycosyltransferase involved in cell wall biosynthesis
MQAARGKYVVTVDADGEHPIEKIPQLMRYFIDGSYDVVSCNRTHRISNKFSSKVREFGMWLLNTQVYVLYGYPLKDAISGMWMVRRDVLPQLKLS